MKQEDKELLLVDLSAKLPYKVKIECINADNETVIEELFTIGIEEDIFDCNMIEYVSVKPYLFPLSSMTEEQRNEFLNIQSEDRKLLLDTLIKYRYEKEDKIPIIPLQKHIDWLNANLFDYRGLIEKGLAIDATNKNIY